MSTSVASCRRWCLRLPSLFIGIAAIGGSRADEQPAASARVWISAGGQRFALTLADAEAARAFAARLPMTLDMSDLNDNEKKFNLPKNLPANPVRPGTIRNGDLMLWGDNTMVLFYKLRNFRNPDRMDALGIIGNRHVRCDEAPVLRLATGPMHQARGLRRGSDIGRIAERENDGVHSRQRRAISHALRLLDPATCSPASLPAGDAAGVSIACSPPEAVAN